MTKDTETRDDDEDEADDDNLCTTSITPAATLFPSSILRRKYYTVSQ